MTDEYKLKMIGVVRNEFFEPIDNLKIKVTESKIIVDEAYSEGLLSIESLDYIDVVFIFHQSDSEPLEGIAKSGKRRGVFASRLPRRPNSIGVTTAKLLKREGNVLTVTGLDALDGSPVIDIKSGDTSMFASEADYNLQHNAILKREPRKEIRNNIAKEETDILLLKAAQMHGHFCPGLAMGVVAAVYAMNKMQADSDGLEDLLAVTETNNCFSDGIQFVTGCTFGNNSLIFRDIGKTAFTLTKRDGKGIRVIARNNARNVLKEVFPDHKNLYQKVVAEKNHDSELAAEYKRSSVNRAFGTLKIPFSTLFKIQDVTVDIPEYAPSHDSTICGLCGENTMASRIIKENGKSLCYDCSEKKFSMLDGDGIHMSN